MNVRELRQHLADLAKVLVASKAKAVADDLGAICDGLVPFENYALKDFASFLVKAEAFSRGDVPVKGRGGVGKAGGGRGGRTSAKISSADAEAVSNEIKEIYRRAAVAPEGEINSAIAKLGGLSKPQLLAVANTIELKVAASKAMPTIIEAIRQRIMARKGTSQRAETIDRPIGSHAGSVDPMNSFNSD